MIRRMTLGDIPKVVAIHQSSWSPYEISVKLGSDYLALFYTKVVQGPHSFGYVSASDDKIIGYASGFYDYHAFNKSLQREVRMRLGVILLKRVFTRKVGLGDIVNLLIDEKKLRRARYPKYHLGALALANEYKGTPVGGQAITGAIGSVLRELESKGCPGCWGLCDTRNIPMRKYLLKIGFEDVDKIDFIGRSVVLYEKTFNSPPI